MKKSFVSVEHILASDFPPVLRIFWNQTEVPEFKVANVLCVLTCLCAMSPRLRFVYFYDGKRKPHRLLIHCFVVAQSGDGKSFSDDVYNLTMAPVIERDRKEEAKELEWVEQKRMTGDSKDKPKEPVTVKICLNKFTRNKIIKRAHMMIRKYGEPLTFMVFTNELSTLVERRGSFGDLRDIAKLAYDSGALISTDTNCDASYNATVDICWCSILNTTPRILNRYMDKDAIESGNVNRNVYIPLGDLLGDDSPMFKELTDADLELIAETQRQLMGETYTEEDTLQPMHDVDMDWLFKDEKAWCDKQREEVNKTGSYAHNSFYKRSSTSAARLATMVYHLWGEDPKKRAKVRRLYYFFADYILAGQMKIFGKKYEDLVEVINYGDDDNTRSESIYDCLPKRFSRQQLNAKREEMKLVTETRKFIFKWLKKKWIVKVEGEEDLYEKLF